MADIIIPKIQHPTRKLCHSKSNCIYLFLFFFLLSLGGCSTPGHIQRKPAKSLTQLWDNLDVASNHHTGLSVYDPKNNKFIFNYREDNFFVPASNIKLLTLYAAAHYLDKFVPAAYYSTKGDTMIIWGGGDPGTKFPSIHRESPLINFIKESDHAIIFSKHHFNSHRFGQGWSWDDYPFNFQPEKTAFPIYGNKLWVESYHDSIVLTPSYFQLVFKTKKDTVQKLTRNEWGTAFNYRYDTRKPYSISSIPVSLYEHDIRYIWEEATGKKIYFINEPLDRNALRLDGSERDTLLKWMMHESENFIAEQLLLSCALRQTGNMNEKAFIDQMLQGPLSGMPDSISWVDGSGLSRYNLLTPRSAVWVLEKLLEKNGLDYIKSIFPAGGRSGTLRDQYHSGEREPYLYAKTGSMRNVYCISGVLVTRKGKVLLFSWMNNQFRNDPREIKISMERFFTYLRDYY